MNILHALPYWTIGGIESFVATLSRFSSHDHYVRVDKQFYPLPDYLPEWGEEGVDVLHYHHAKPVVKLPQRDDLFRAFRVFTAHNLYSEQPQIGKPHRLVATSDSIAEALATHNLVVDDVIPPCVDLEVFRGGMEGVQEWADRLSLSVNKPIVMWAGRMCLGKRPRLLANIIQACPEYAFLVVGDDYLGGNRGHIYNEVWDALQQPNVYHVSSVEHEDLAGLYRLADVFLSTSRREGFGLTVVEAMACGTPVVVPDVPALNEIVGYGDYGQVVESVDVDRFRGAIEKAIEERFGWSCAGVKRVHSLGVEAMRVAARYDEVYEEADE